jgi:2-methylcitrate dehydratase PrpD
MSGQISENPILSDLCERLHRPVSATSLHRARLHLLDWVGCAAAGSQSPVGEILKGQNAHDPLSLAFAWGGLGNVLEMDDVDKRALLHPGPSIIPAALAVATADTSITDLLTAMVRGYEATIRLGRAVGAGHYALFHSTGTCGAIGAAAAAASLKGLNITQTAHALALAISQSAGLWHTRHDAESMAKQLHTAAAARDGVQAALLAEAGFLGPLRILEGEQGFFQAMCPGADARDVLAASEQEWLIHDVSFKPWPACRHAHAVIDAALELKPLLQDAPVSSIEVRTYADALKFCDQPNPKTVIEAKFSLQHAVAVVLARGAPALSDFEMDAIEDAALKQLRQKVQVGSDPTFDQVYPAHFGAEIRANGHTVRVPDALGDPENPVSEAQIHAKAAMLLEADGIAEPEGAALIDQVMTASGTCSSLLDRLKEGLA